MADMADSIFRCPECGVEGKAGECTGSAAWRSTHDAHREELEHRIHDALRWLDAEAEALNSPTFALEARGILRGQGTKANLETAKFSPAGFR